MTTPSLAVPHASPLHALAPRRPSLIGPSTLAGVTAALVGALVLVRWVVDPGAFQWIEPGTVTMKANAALCVVLIGCGTVLLARPGEAGRGHRRLGLLLVAGSVSIALATWFQDLSHIDLGIDELLIRDTAEQSGTLIPGRMAAVTAVSLLTLGLGAAMAPRWRRLVVLLCAAVLGMAVLTVSNYVLDASEPAIIGSYTPMAFTTAVTLGILGLGILGLLGPANPLASLAGRSPTAALLRRILVVLVAIPVGLAWLRLEGEHLGLLGTGYGTSLILLAIMVVGVIAILRTASWANQLEATRDASEIERRRFFELSPDMLSVIGADGRFRRVNWSWETVLGYPDGELIGRSFLEFVHPDDVERTVAQAARQYGDAETTVAFQNRYRHHDGSYRWLEWMSRTSPDRSLAYGIARDVTDRKRQEERRVKRQAALETRNETLSERSIRDPLTGLHNRRYFDVEVARLERRWSARPASQRPPVALIMFDLDQFGEINKLYGHQAGDAVLRVFSGLLSSRFRERDLVARYGGDEFVAVLENVTASQATLIAEELRARFERETVDIGTATPIRCTVSAGCAHVADGGSAMAALAEADVWLAQAKRGGRNQVVGL